MTATLTVTEYLAKHKITATAVPIPFRTNLPEGTWEPSARHWEVTLWRRITKRRAARLVVEFSQGSAHKEPPTAADVLDCLRADAAGSHDLTFLEWCGENDQNADSIKAHETFRLVQKQTKALDRFLGFGDLFRELIADVEGL